MDRVESPYMDRSSMTKTSSTSTPVPASFLWPTVAPVPTPPSSSSPLTSSHTLTASTSYSVKSPQEWKSLKQWSNAAPKAGKSKRVSVLATVESSDESNLFLAYLT